MKITLFKNVASKNGESLISLGDFANLIINGSDEHMGIILKIREAAREGRHEDVRLLKLKLMAVSFAGNCLNGRFFPKITERTGLAMFDIDKISAAEIEAAREKLRVFPWVALIHTTCSGMGLRVVVNIGLLHIEVYRDGYEIVGETIEQITGLKLDMQCKDFARISLLSYDPDAFINPDPEIFPFPPGRNPLNYQPYYGPDTSEDFRVPVLGDEACKNLVVNAARNLPEHNASVDYMSVVDRFFSINEYVQGSRHNFLLRLGGYMRWRGLGSADVYSALEYINTQAAGNGMGRAEIRSAVMWGFANGKRPPRDYISCAEGTAEDENRVNKVKKVSNDPFPAHGGSRSNTDTPGSEAGTDDDSDIDNDALETESEVICRLCPTIPDEVFESLPEFIKEIARTGRTTRERDVLVLSTIVNLSGIFSNLRTLYGDVWYSPHLYLCVTGGAGSGKGKAMVPATLCSEIEKEFEKAYHAQMVEYREKAAAWEVEVRKAAKENRLPDFSLCPDEPVKRSINMHSNTSRSRMLHNLRDNQADGMVMNIPELDILSSALNADYGRHTSFFRGIFHHEPLGQDFKVDAGAVYVERPALACNISATFGQLVAFINNIEDGMYSRFLFYLLPTLYEWVSPAPRKTDGGTDLETMMKEKSARLKEHFFRYREKILVEFTDEQWARHNELFGGLMSSMAGTDKEGINAIVVRAGLISCRIAMTLCGVQIMEAGWNVKSYTCPDEIMNAAMEITSVCFRHSLHLTTIFRAKENRDRLSNFNREDEILSKMPDKFSYTQFIDKGMTMGVSKSSIKNDLKKLLKKGSVVKDRVIRIYHKSRRKK